MTRRLIGLVLMLPFPLACMWFVSTLVGWPVIVRWARFVTVVAALFALYVIGRDLWEER